VARRFDPELEAFLVAEATRRVQTQAGFTVLPNYAFSDRPAMDAFLTSFTCNSSGKTAPPGLPSAARTDAPGAGRGALN
jgi:hypothetical protein